jgi:hypothetical protein
MADIEVAVTEADLTSVLTQKIRDITNLEIRLAALLRTIAEQSQKIEQLESISHIRESSNASGRKEEIPV